MEKQPRQLIQLKGTDLSSGRTGIITFNLTAGARIGLDSRGAVISIRTPSPGDEDIALTVLSSGLDLRSAPSVPTAGDSKLTEDQDELANVRAQIKAITGSKTVKIPDYARY